MEIEEHPVGWDETNGLSPIVSSPAAISGCPLEPGLLILCLLQWGRTRDEAARGFLFGGSLPGSVRAMMGRDRFALLGPESEIRKVLQMHQLADMGTALVQEWYVEVQRPQRFGQGRENRIPLDPETLRGREFVQESSKVWIRSFEDLRASAHSANALKAVKRLDQVIARLRDAQTAVKAGIEPVQRLQAVSAFAHQESSSWLKAFGSALDGERVRSEGSARALLLAAADGYAREVATKLRMEPPIVTAGHDLAVLPGDLYGDTFLRYPTHLLHRAGSFPLLGLGVAEAFVREHGWWSEEPSELVYEKWDTSELITAIAFTVIGDPLGLAMRRFGHPRFPVAEQWHLRLVAGLSAEDAGLSTKLGITPYPQGQPERERARAALLAGAVVEGAPLLAVDLLLEHAYGGGEYINEPAVIGSSLRRELAST